MTHQAPARSSFMYPWPFKWHVSQSGELLFARVKACALARLTILGSSSSRISSSRNLINFDNLSAHSHHSWSDKITAGCRGGWGVVLTSCCVQCVCSAVQCCCIFHFCLEWNLLLDHRVKYELQFWRNKPDWPTTGSLAKPVHWVLSPRKRKQENILKYPVLSVEYLMLPNWYLAAVLNRDSS